MSVCRLATLRKNCRATAWRMIVFTSAPAGLFVERAHFTGDSVVLQRYFEITSYQGHFALEENKKIFFSRSGHWLQPTQADYSQSPFDCTCALVETHFSSGCVLTRLNALASSTASTACVCGVCGGVCVDCIAECVHDVRRAKSYSHVCGTHSRSFSHHRRLTFVRERRGTSSAQNVEKERTVHQHVCSCQSEITFRKPFLARKTLSFSQWQQWSPRASCDSPPRKG